jgi:hypothetical protein
MAQGLKVWGMAGHAAFPDAVDRTHLSTMYSLVVFEASVTLTARLSSLQALQRSEALNFREPSLLY